MGFLVKKKENDKIPKERTKEELKSHNLEVIEKYKKELEATSEIFLMRNESSPGNKIINGNEFNPIGEIMIEQALDVKNEPLNEKIDKDLEEIKIIEKVEEEEDLIAEFEKDTGKHAIWRGKMTKTYQKWKEKRLNK